MIIQAKITSKGQVTIPKRVRDYLKASAGDKLQFIIDRQGRVILTIKTVSIADVLGAFHHKARKKTTIEDMDKAISNRMRRKFK